ncbi:hypothetical protein KKB28_07965 [bacterium]|nr:hypothetical protein [bacterium]
MIALTLFSGEHPRESAQSESGDREDAGCTIKRRSRGGFHQGMLGGSVGLG